MTLRWLRLAFLPLILAAGACGGGADKSSGDLSAQEVLDRAATRFASVKSFHYKLEHEKGSTEIPLGLRLERAEGDVLLPDRLSAEVEAKAGGLAVRVKVIAIGDKTWITNPFTRQYQRLPGSASIGDVVDPGALVSAVSKSMKEPRIEGSESVDGALSYRIRGKIASGDIQDALSFADSGLTLDVVAWVGRDDFLVRRARIEGPLLPNEDKGIARQLDLSRFDAPITINEP